MYDVVNMLGHSTYEEVNSSQTKSIDLHDLHDIYMIYMHRSLTMKAINISSLHEPHSNEFCTLQHVLFSWENVQVISLV